MSTAPPLPEMPLSSTDDLLAQEIEEHCAALEKLHRAISRPFDNCLRMIAASIRSGGKILLFGNGGSAADAQHIAAELVIRYKTDRPAISALALTTDSSALTACGNDLGFDSIYSRQIEALARPGDIALGISTSGRSPNVIAGLREARRLDVRTIGLGGETGGDMAMYCDELLLAPSRTTARIQEMHILIGHMLCRALEQQLGFVAA